MKPIHLLLSVWVLLRFANPAFNATSEKKPTGLTPVHTFACPVNVFGK
ncbi:MAG: hypothetical protein ACE5IY_22495 [bacterium]